MSRILKPDFFSDPALSDVTIPARLLLVGLRTLADRCGSVPNKPKLIHGKLFPFNPDADVPLWLSELEAAGTIKRDDATIHVSALVRPETEQVDKTKRFEKPTPQQVRQYAASIKFDLDGQRFCDYYDSRGWRIANQPMKDWKAAVRTWKRNHQERAQQPTFALPKDPIPYYQPQTSNEEEVPW